MRSNVKDGHWNEAGRDAVSPRRSSVDIPPQPGELFLEAGIVLGVTLVGVTAVQLILLALHIAA